MQDENKQIRSEVFINKDDAPKGVVAPKKINPNSEAKAEYLGATSHNSISPLNNS